MPVKDKARDAAFAAMKDARGAITALCRETLDDRAADGAVERAAARLAAMLEQHGFAVSLEVAGLAGAVRGTASNLDREAMRKGLRHGHVAFLVPLDDDPGARDLDGRPAGLAAALSGAVGLAGALAAERGTVTVIGYPGDAGLVGMARAGLFDAFDAVFGARPAPAGEGFPFTIDATGQTLAFRSARVSFGGAVDAETLASRLNETRRDDDVIGVGERVDSAVDLTLSSRTSLELRDLSGRVKDVVESLDPTGSAAIEWGDPLDDTLVSRILARRVKTYSDTLGHKFDRIHKTEPGPPSGWGSVSQAAPAFVLHFPIGATATERDERFAREAASAEAFNRAFNFGESLAMTGIDALRDMEFRAVADDQLVKAHRARGVTRSHRRWLGVHPVIPSPEDEQERATKKKGPKLADFRMVRGPGMRDN